MLLVMVAAGATILMAASEENSPSEAGSGTTSSVNQSTYPRCRETQHSGQRSNESSPKADVVTCSSNIGMSEGCQACFDILRLLFCPVEVSTGGNVMFVNQYLLELLFKYFICLKEFQECREESKNVVRS